MIIYLVRLHQEREERRKRLKRERPDDGPMHMSQTHMNDQLFQTKNHRPYDRNKLPPGTLWNIFDMFWGWNIFFKMEGVKVQNFKLLNAWMFFYAFGDWDNIRSFKFISYLFYENVKCSLGHILRTPQMERIKPYMSIVARISAWWDFCLSIYGFLTIVVRAHVNTALYIYVIVDMSHSVLILQFLIKFHMFVSTCPNVSLSYTF